MQMLVKKGMQKMWTGGSALAPLCSSATNSSDLYDSFVFFCGGGNGGEGHMKTSGRKLFLQDEN